MVRIRSKSGEVVVLPTGTSVEVTDTDGNVAMALTGAPNSGWNLIKAGSLEAEIYAKTHKVNFCRLVTVKR